MASDGLTDIRIEGAGPNTNYVLKTSEPVRPGQGKNEHDILQNRTAFGTVYHGQDTLHTSGRVTDITLAGPGADQAKVFVDGEQVDPSQFGGPLSSLRSLASAGTAGLAVLFAAVFAAVVWLFGGD